MEFFFTLSTTFFLKYKKGDQGIQGHGKNCSVDHGIESCYYFKNIENVILELHF